MKQKKFSLMKEKAQNSELWESDLTYLHTGQLGVRNWFSQVESCYLNI